MRKLLIISSALFISSAFFMSCKVEKPEPFFDFGYRFFPIDSGSYSIYSVDSIAIKDNAIDTFNYFLKCQFVSSILNQNGEKIWRLQRSIASDTLNWKEIENHFVKLTNTQLIVTESNKDFLKISFPIGVGKTWNGNIYNNLPKQNYQILNLNTEMIIEEQNDSNFVFEIFKRSIYESELGLVKQYNTFIEKQNGMANGFRLKYTFLRHQK